MLRLKSICFKHLPTIIFTIVSLVLLNLINGIYRKPNINISQEIRSYTFNKNFLDTFSLGNRRLVSSFLWTKTLIESDIEHVNDKKSWMYYRFDTISHLDPFFYENYLFGGIYLSIIKDDLTGAADIYEKGLLHYPTDYRLLYNAAFNYYFEMGNKEKALEKYNLLLHHPYAKNFKILPRLIATISNDSEDKELGFQLLLESYLKMDEGILKERTHQSLYALRSEIDLNCLNKKGTNCKRYDLNGKPYFYEDGIWKAESFYKKLKKRRNKKAPKN